MAGSEHRLSRLLIAALSTTITISIMTFIWRSSCAKGMRSDPEVATQTTHADAAVPADAATIFEMMFVGPVCPKDDMLEVSSDGGFVYQPKISELDEDSSRVSGEEALRIAKEWAMSALSNRDERISFTLENVLPSMRGVVDPKSPKFDWLVSLQQRFSSIDAAKCIVAVCVRGSRVIRATGRSCAPVSGGHTVRVDVCTEAEAIAAIQSYLRNPWITEDEASSLLRGARVRRVWIVESRSDDSESHSLRCRIRPGWILDGRASICVDAESKKVEMI